MPKASKSRQKLLSSSRRPASVSSTTSIGTTRLSSKRTRSVIRTHHTLQKRLSQATTAKDEERVRDLESRLAETGGLKLYQKASTIGQGRERGGDTSKVLVEWLGDRGILPRTLARTKSGSHELNEVVGMGQALRMLEVGALSTQNALNITGETRVRRLDLHSQHEGIEEVDFMALDPGEEWEGEKGYDVLSLSLVVNFVGDPRARGEMLRHTVQFLRSRRSQHAGVSPGRRWKQRWVKEDCENDGQSDEEDRVENHNDPDETDDQDGRMITKEATRRALLPALFLVLPLPCVDNSRYLTEERLTAIMDALRL